MGPIRSGLEFYLDQSPRAKMGLVGYLSCVPSDSRMAMFEVRGQADER